MQTWMYTHAYIYIYTHIPLEYSGAWAESSGPKRQKLADTDPDKWRFEFLSSPCKCAASRTNIGDCFISCLESFARAGLDAYSIWRSGWDQLHKLDQDRAVLCMSFTTHLLVYVCVCLLPSSVALIWCCVEF